MASISAKLEEGHFKSPGWENRDVSPLGRVTGTVATVVQGGVARLATVAALKVEIWNTAEERGTASSPLVHTCERTRTHAHSLLPTSVIRHSGS